MSEPVRTITFTATLDGVAPTDRQDAGIQGEHNATQVVFALDAALIRPEYLYRFEYVDGGGGWDTTDHIALTENRLSVLLPAAWTAAGGCGTIRLQICQLDADSQEELILYTFPGRLLFADRDTGEPMAWEYEKGLSGLIADTHSAAAGADAAAGRANAAAQSAEAIAQEVQGKLDRGELTGPKGDKGDKGEAATVSVGTVTTGAAGSAAEVTNAGTTGAAVLHFTIPRGDKGETGAAGPAGPQGPKGDTGEGLTIKGRYDTLEALESAVPSPAAGDNYYVGTAAPYAVYTFTGTDGWLNGGPLQGAKGDTGPAGPQGAAGPQGEPGPNELSGSTATAFAGLLKGNGTKVTTAVAGADYATPAQLEGKLDKTGGTLLGMLNAAGGLSIGVTDSLLKTTPGGVVNNAIADTDYATPGYVNGQISAHDSASGAHADLFDAKLDKTGGTINGALTVSGTLTVSTGTLYANSGIGLPTKSAIIKTTAGGLTTGATAGTDYEQVTIGGTTDRGYAKFASGLLVCWGNQGFGTQSITTAWGNLYEGPEYCIFSDFAYAFSAAPAVTAIQNYRSNSAFFVEGIYSTTATSPGKFIPVRPSPASVIVAASYIAIGRWK